MTQSEGNFDASKLCRLFDSLFAAKYRTELVGGAAEPLYHPVDAGWHRIYFTRDYFASALHEVAHWCIAGPVRRQKVDYGYWYTPDGRNAEQQKAFEQLEVRPQALEWMFCTAAGVKFRVSADNLSGDGQISETFKAAIWRQTQAYCQSGMPSRGRQFAEGIRRVFGGGDFADPDCYRLEALS